MIPKIIHYCWFGKSDKPAKLLEYIETWRKFLPNYKIKEWNESNFDVNMFAYTREAYSAGKYAFVSDVARLYALREEGGIYFDTDIEVLKSFDDLLGRKYLIGYEAFNYVGTGVIGCERGTFFISAFLDTYLERNFVLDDGTFDLRSNPLMLTKFISENKLDLEIFDMDYFCAKSYLTGQIEVTVNTYCIHHYSGSWLTPWQKMKKAIHYLLKR